jgi:hypothetical protein
MVRQWSPLLRFWLILGVKIIWIIWKEGHMMFSHAPETTPGEKNLGEQ